MSRITRIALLAKVVSSLTFRTRLCHAKMAIKLPFIVRLMGRKRRLRLSQLGAFVASALVLSGCIVSPYDISSELEEAFPLESDEYILNAPTSADAVIQRTILIKTAEGYDQFSKDKYRFVFGSPIRFFTIPEYDGYIAQQKAQNGQYGYVFLKNTSKGIVSTLLPSKTGVRQIISSNYLGNLVDKKAVNDEYPTIVPLKPYADTLKVLREVARRKIEFASNTYVRAPPDRDSDCNSDLDERDAVRCRLQAKDRAIFAEYRRRAQVLSLQELKVLRIDQDAFGQKLILCEAADDFSSCLTRTYDNRLAELGLQPKGTIIGRDEKTENSNPAALAADDSRAFTVSLGEDLPVSLTNSPSVTLNRRTYTIASIDAKSRSIKLLGADKALLPGLNFLSSLPVWYENRQLSTFSEPYKSSYAIVAAIDDYDRLPSGSKEYDKLDHMVEKATELKAILMDLGFPKENIFSYFNKDATAVNLRNALYQFWKGGKFEKADRLVFYFGGHGAGPDGQGYLVTWDFDPTRPTVTGFLMSDVVYTHFPNTTVKHVLVALDACSSGLAIPGMRSLDDPNTMPDFKTLAQIREAVDKPARNLLVAGTDQQRALAPDGGLFTRALIQGLKGDGDVLKNGIIQFDGLAFYIRAKVVGDAAQLLKRQRPGSYKADMLGNGEVVFLRQRRD
jgi:hypothetical protein